MAQLVYEYTKEVSSVPNTTTLSIQRENISSATIDNYCIFAGGTNWGICGEIDIYNNALVKTITDLGYDSYDMGAVENVNFAIFVGGCTSTLMSSRHDKVSLFDSNLTNTLQTAPRPVVDIAGARTGKAGKYAVFAGGLLDKYATGSREAYAYDSSATLSTLSSLSMYGRCKEFSVGDYAVFLAAVSGSTYDDMIKHDGVEAYNNSLTKSVLTPLGRYSPYISGHSDTFGFIGFNNAAFIYNSDLTQTLFEFSTSFYLPSSGVAKCGDLIMFALDSATHTINSSFTLEQKSNLSVPRREICGGYVGDYMLFAGGHHPSQVSTYYNTVDIYLYN